MESIPVVVTYISGITPVWSKELFDIQSTTECRFTHKHVCNRMRVHSSKISCLSTFLFHFIISFTAEFRNLRFYMVEQFQSRLVRIGLTLILFIWSEEVSFKLFFINPPEKSCLPIWSTIIQMVIEDILSPAAFAAD